jgi:cytochrome c oxidase subunit 2
MIARALRTKRILIALCLAVGVLLVLGAIPAFADVFTPEDGGSPNADRIDTLYKITGVLGLIVLAGVEGALIYSLVKYRRRRGDPEPVQIAGNAGLELGWTIGAIVLVAAIATVTFIYLPGIIDPEKSGPGGLARAAGVPYAAVGQPDPPPGGKSMQIHVNGQQYIWRFDYVGEKPITEGRPLYAYTDMVVPINTTVILKINSSDVAHSWWVPKLGGKADAIPGHTNETWFKIKNPGTYWGQCAELCGENHADMRNRVIALPVDQYQSWLDTQRKDLIAAQDGLASMRKAGVGNPFPEAKK